MRKLILSGILALGTMASLLPSQASADPVVLGGQVAQDIYNNGLRTLEAGRFQDASGAWWGIYQNVLSIDAVGTGDDGEVVVTVTLGPEYTRALTPAPVPTTDPLGLSWDVGENGWKGTWVRRGTSDTFDATWVHYDSDGKEDNRETAVLTITITGNTVTIQQRHDSKGDDSDYTGTLWADGVQADGTDTIVGGPHTGETGTWKAHINR